jgi:excisionase family DNA binding protein
MIEVPPDTVAVLKVPALLSVATAARLLDVSPRTLRRRIDEGALPAVREHDRTMIRADELRAYVDQLERAGGRPGLSPRRGPGSRIWGS